MIKYDVQAVKNALAGRLPEALQAVTKLDAKYFSGAHVPCPKHCSPGNGGKDRANFARDDSGGFFCNVCQPGTGDVIGTFQWINGIDFEEAVEGLAKFAGVEPKRLNSKNKPDPADHLEFLPWNDSIVGLWCLKKKPIAMAAVKSVGASLSMYRGRYQVIAIPIWGPRFDDQKPVGWVMYQTNGQPLPVWSGGSKPTDFKKVKITGGSERGVICDPMKFKDYDGQNRRIWKTEGPSDLLTMITIAPDEASFTTANGAKENPVHLSWFIQHCKDAVVNVVHDADLAGEHGAIGVKTRSGERPGWCQVLAESAKIVKNVKLPFEVVETNGADLRDFANNGGTLDDLLDLAATAQQFSRENSSTPTPIDEAEDDPHRLARINLRYYETEHNGRLVFYKDEWWKYKDGHYRRIEPNEFKSKVNAAIRRELETCWRERPNERKSEPVKKVTHTLVANVIGAMASMCLVPSSIKMPCWLPDRTHRHYLSAKNGILNLDAIFAGKGLDEILLPHSPDWFCSLRLNYEFNPDASCPKWMDCINYSMDGDIERINILQEWAGYLLTPMNSHQKFLALEGQGGNGKTVYFAGMTAMLGEDNVSNVPIEGFDSRFDLVTTLGKAANISGDTGEIDSVAEGMLKQFTGGDVMHFDRKNLSPISARPTAKLMVAWNTRPRIKDKSQGLWRRMLLVPFNRAIPDDRKVLDMDTPQWWIDSGEAPGILLWAMAGLDRLKQQKGFTKSLNVIESMAEYRGENNPAIEFFSDHLEADDNSSVHNGNLYSLYSYWCSQSGYKALGNAQFGKELRRHFPNAKRVQKRIGSGRVWEMSGVKLSVDEICGKPVDGRTF